MTNRQFEFNLNGWGSSTMFIVNCLLFLSVFRQLIGNCSTQSVPFCGKSERLFLQGRIVGGEESSNQAWPWMISIHKFDPERGQYLHHCGGTLINPFWVITAAHCVYKKNPHHLRLYLGPTDHHPYGKKVIRPRKLIWHPDYAHTKFYNDIALIYLEEPVEYDDDIAPINLPQFQLESRNNDDADNLNNNAAQQDVGDYTEKMATAIGWGALAERSTFRPEKLRHVHLPVLTRNQCLHRLRIIHRLRINWLHPSWMCAGYQQGGKDACQGDSGGPLVVEENGQWNLIGVISSGTGCARRFQPGIYTKVNQFLHWIHSTINNYKHLDSFINQDDEN